MIQMVNNSIKMQINLPSENFAFWVSTTEV